MFIEKSETCNFADDNTIYYSGEDLSNVLEKCFKLSTFQFMILGKNYKLHALRRIRKYLLLEKVKLLCNTFINSQFNYALLTWMFCSKRTTYKDSKDSPQRTKDGI